VIPTSSTLVDNNCHIWDGDAYKNYCKKVIRDKEIVRYLKSYSTDTEGVPTIEHTQKMNLLNELKQMMSLLRSGVS
jgi:hypothetical protein